MAFEPIHLPLEGDQFTKMRNHMIDMFGDTSLPPLLYKNKIYPTRLLGDERFLLSASPADPASKIIA